jgi:hypothetical protein
MDKSHANVKDAEQESWYPSKPPLTHASQVRDISQKIEMKATAETVDSSAYWDEIWQKGDLEYISSNKWDGISKKSKQSSRKYRVDGVEIRLLGKDHPLCGEYGLFASKRFSPFDIIGKMHIL